MMQGCHCKYHFRSRPDWERTKRYGVRNGFVAWLKAQGHHLSATLKTPKTRNPKMAAAAVYKKKSDVIGCWAGVAYKVRRDWL